ncbi:MAG: cellulose synthase family protein [Bacteroidota bacterium]
MEIAVVVLYSVSLLFIFLFSIGQLNLTWFYLRSRKHKKQDAEVEEELKEYPMVTIQLPLYNEKYVAERLIEAVSSFDYPRDRFEIQVLDDSTDETVDIIREKINALDSDIQIEHIQRENRVGFKAGALKYGTEIAKGDYIAIFDADFLPKPEFLKKTLPYFKDDSIGVVQTRWGHLNKDYSTLTKLQAFGLDAHFSIEQSGRSYAGSFINFNGTAGIWRKSCIYDAGGWSSDTLTEDLDLSYRAQMKGWKFKFLEDLESPAELPVIMPAVKSQQYRWNKGAAETAKKNIWKVWTSDIKLVNKWHAFFHLFNSSVFISLFIAAILSIPMLYIKFGNPAYDFYFDLGSVFLLGFFSIGFFYWISSKRMVPEKTGRYFFRTFPTFLTVSMGLSLHNAVAVLEGLFGLKSDFIRTPKFNILKKSDSWKNNEYIRPKINFMTLLEGFLALYFIFGIVSGFVLEDYGLMFFHIMLSLGFLGVFYQSVKPIAYGGNS